MNTAGTILSKLRNKDKVSGEDLAKKLDLSRTAIWKAINTLRDMGYGIDGDHKGYTLVKVPDILYPFELTPLLKTTVIGVQIDHSMSVGSTNEKARQFAEAGWPDGGVIISEKQETGKGRLGRVWSSPPGGIWFSMLLRPRMSPSEAPTLTLAGGVAVAEALANLGFDARLKWPNDILLGDKKVCGILTEMNAEMERINYIIMGIGINANCTSDELPKEVRGRATTLLEVQGSSVDRKRLLVDILTIFEGLYNKGQKEIISRWKKRSST